MNGRPNHVPGKEEFNQGNEVEHHAQAGGVQRDPAEKVAGAAEREKRVNQADEITSQREAKPK